jgi:hypothetical protein
MQRVSSRFFRTKVCYCSCRKFKLEVKYAADEPWNLKVYVLAYSEPITGLLSIKISYYFLTFPSPPVIEHRPFIQHNVNFQPWNKTIFVDGPVGRFRQSQRWLAKRECSKSGRMMDNKFQYNILSSYELLLLSLLSSSSSHGFAYLFNHSFIYVDISL